MPARRLPQHGFQFELCGAGQGNGADLAALALDCQLAGFDGAQGGRGIQPENLMNAQAAVPCQTDRGSVVLASFAPCLADHAVDFLIAPCAVGFAKRAPFQIEHRIGRKLGVLAAGQLIVEKADGGEVGLDGGCCAAVFLEELRIRENMLGRDVRNALDVVDLCEEIAEAADGLFVAAAGLDAALAAVAEYALDLREQVLIDGIGFHSAPPVRRETGAVHPSAKGRISARFPCAAQKVAHFRCVLPRCFRLKCVFSCRNGEGERRAVRSVSVGFLVSIGCRVRRKNGCTLSARRAQRRANAGHEKRVRSWSAAGSAADGRGEEPVLPDTGEGTPAPLGGRNGCAERPKKLGFAFPLPVLNQNAANGQRR